MLRLIVDWVGRKFNRVPETIEVVGNATVVLDEGAIALPGPTPAVDVLEQALPEVEQPTPSELGIRFQRREFKKLLNAVGHWKSVEFFTAGGRPIETMRDVPRGADGGIDAVIRIVTDTEHGARVVAGKIRRMIVQQAY